MRKSSLDKFRHIHLARPLRLSNLVDGERPSKRSAEQEIQLPGQQTSKSSRKTKRRSRSQESVRGNFQTPQMGDMRVQSSHPQPIGSVCRGQSVAGSTKKKALRKDSRPILDKNFQALELAKVRDYFKSDSVSNTLGPVELNPRAMTLKLFVQLMNELLKELFPQHVINMTNYTEEIPLLMNMLHYPGKIMRSWLVAATAPHSFPHVLGAVSWLVNLLTTTSGQLHCVESEDLVCSTGGFVKTYVQYHMQCYKQWNEGVEDFTDQDESLKKTLEQMLGSDRDHDVLHRELGLLMQELNNPKELAEIGKLKGFQEDINKLSMMDAVMDDRLQQQEDIERVTLQKYDKSIKLHYALIAKDENLKSRVVCLQEKINQQPMTIKDKERILIEIAELKAIVKMQECQCDENKKNVYDNDMSIARLRRKINSSSLMYSNILRENTGELLQLDNIQLDVQDVYKNFDLQADIDKCLQDFETVQNATLRDANNKLMKFKFEEQKKAELSTEDQDDFIRFKAQVKTQEHEFKSFKVARKEVEVTLKEKITALQVKMQTLQKQHPDVLHHLADLGKEEEVTQQCKIDLTNAKNECEVFMNAMSHIYTDAFKKYRQEIIKIFDESNIDN